MFKLFEKFGRKIGLGKSPLKSMTMRGVALYQFSEPIVNKLCVEKQMLPPDYCFYATTAVGALESIGAFMIAAGLYRRIVK
jgi:hypothetical protein